MKLYIVTIGEYYGRGDTPERALSEAKDNASIAYSMEDMVDEGINLYEADFCKTHKVITEMIISPM